MVVDLMVGLSSSSRVWRRESLRTCRIRRRARWLAMRESCRDRSRLAAWTLARMSCTRRCTRTRSTKYPSAVRGTRTRCRLKYRSVGPRLRRSSIPRPMVLLPCCRDLTCGLLCRSVCTRIAPLIAYLKRIFGRVVAHRVRTSCRTRT